MLTHPTLDQLKALNLDGMADAFVELQNRAQAAELSHAEWLRCISAVTPLRQADFTTDRIKKLFP